MNISPLDSLSLDLLHTGYAKLDSKWQVSHITSPFSRLFYISTGQAKMNHSNQLFDLEPGYIYLIPSFKTYSYSCPDYHEQYYVSFFDSLKDGNSIYDIVRFKHQVKATDSDVNLLKRLSEINPEKTVTESRPKSHINTSLSNNYGHNHNYYIETQGLLTILLSRFINTSKKNNTNSNMSHGLNEILSYIKKNLNNDLSIHLLADNCGLNVDYFSRQFFKNFGIRPNKYIQLKRIQQAQLQLATTNYSLKQIAQNVGMENVSYFSRTFKKLTGNTPANFRKQHLNI